MVEVELSSMHAYISCLEVISVRCGSTVVAKNADCSVLFSPSYTGQGLAPFSIPVSICTGRSTTPQSRNNWEGFSYNFECLHVNLGICGISRHTNL